MHANYNARSYLPGLGTFAQADTWEGEFGNPQTLNAYAYTLGNPLRYTDPSGHESHAPYDPRQDPGAWYCVKEAAQSEPSVKTDEDLINDTPPHTGTAMQGVTTGILGGVAFQALFQIASKSTPAGWVASGLLAIGSFSSGLGLANTAKGWFAANTSEEELDIEIEFASGFAGGKFSEKGFASRKPYIINGKIVIPEGNEIVINESTIRAALQDAPVLTLQDAVSIPMLERYILRLALGEKAPAIKMDGSIIVDGNHRYIAGKFLGIMPESLPATAPLSQISKARPIKGIFLDPADWE